MRVSYNPCKAQSPRMYFRKSCCLTHNTGFETAVTGPAMHRIMVYVVYILWYGYCASSYHLLKLCWQDVPWKNVPNRNKATRSMLQQF
jgi:hypothetical protein